jgi:hypothetical protein
MTKFLFLLALFLTILTPRILAEETRINVRSTLTDESISSENDLKQRTSTFGSALHKQISSERGIQPFSALSLVSCTEPFETELLKRKVKRQERGAIAADSIAPKGITIPSLWWAKEQFDPFAGKLIINWLAYPQQQRIDLLVNWQLWTLLDYLKRYRFINNFGTIAREYGYNLRIFNQQNECLAIYRYNSHLNPPQWEIQVDASSLKDSLEVEKKEQGIGEAGVK